MLKKLNLEFYTEKVYVNFCKFWKKQSSNENFNLILADDNLNFNILNFLKSFQFFLNLIFMNFLFTSEKGQNFEISWKFGQIC